MQNRGSVRRAFRMVSKAKVFRAAVVVVATLTGSCQAAGFVGTTGLPNRVVRTTAKNAGNADPGKARLIWFHGLGDTAAGWSFLKQYLVSKGLDHVEVVLPTAPSMPITVNGGMWMPGWFDMSDLPYGLESVDDRNSIESVGVKQMTELIRSAEADGVAPERIVIGGFSQGGCVALVSGLTYPKKLAGIAALSGWLPTFARDSLKDIMPVSDNRPSVLWGHGQNDQLIELPVAEFGATCIQDIGVDLDFRIFHGLGHGAADDELDWLASWLRERLPPPTKV